MTLPVPRVATPEDHPLIDAYVAHCNGFGVSDRAFRNRLRLARAFLKRHLDLEAWMARPIAARLADLRRIKAWPLISFAILSGRVDDAQEPGNCGLPDRSFNWRTGLDSSPIGIKMEQ